MKFFCKFGRIARMNVQGRVSQRERGMDVTLAVRAPKQGRKILKSF